MQKNKIKLECGNCYIYFDVEAKSGEYVCNGCGHITKLEIIDND